MQTLNVEQMNLARIWGIQCNVTLFLPLYTTALLCMQTPNVKQLNVASIWGIQCNVTPFLPLYTTTLLFMQTPNVKQMNPASIWGIQCNVTLPLPLYTTTLQCMQTPNVKQMKLAATKHSHSDTSTNEIDTSGVFQCIEVCCSVLWAPLQMRRINLVCSVCCSVLQCVAVCCEHLCTWASLQMSRTPPVCCSVLQSILGSSAHEPDT